MICLKRAIARRSQCRICGKPLFSWRSFSGNPFDPKSPLKISQSFGNEIDRLFTFENDTSVIKKHKETSVHSSLEQYFIKTKAYFLPNGYPSSTNEGYGKYVSLQAMAYVFATTSSVLSMQCLLYAMGLGENSLPLAATLNWVRNELLHICCHHTMYSVDISVLTLYLCNSIHRS
jgi:hypothetical protein